MISANALFISMAYDITKNYNKKNKENTNNPNRKHFFGIGI